MMFGDPIDAVKYWQSKFRGLKNWSIHYSSQDVYKAQTSAFAPTRTATIYEYGMAEEPADYFLHEMLHIAIKDLLNAVDTKPYTEWCAKEENLVQDICVIWNDIRAERDNLKEMLND